MRRVAIVEDDRECAQACELELTRAGWECLLFEDARSALEAAKGGSFPDLALMDLNLPGEDAFAAIAALKARLPEIEIVALTGRSEDQFLFPALKAGAIGYVLKNDALGRLTDVLNQVKAGAAPMTASIARRVIASLRGEVARAPASAPPSENPPLTGREVDVLSMLAKGLSYEECGGALSISVDTVRSHVRNTYRKLHAASKAEAVAIAMRAGWLS